MYITTKRYWSGKKKNKQTNKRKQSKKKAKRGLLLSLYVSWLEGVVLKRKNTQGMHLSSSRVEAKFNQLPNSNCRLLFYLFIFNYTMTLLFPSHTHTYISQFSSFPIRSFQFQLSWTSSSQKGLSNAFLCYFSGCCFW